MFILKRYKKNTVKNIANKIVNPISKRIMKLGLVLIFLPIIAYTAINIIYFGKIFPGIKIAGLDIGGMKTEKAVEYLNNNLNERVSVKILHNDQRFEIPLDTIDFAYDIQGSVDSAYNLYRTGNIVYDFQKQIAAHFTTHEIGLLMSFSEEKLQEYITVIALQINQEPIAPSSKITNEEVIIENGVPGVEMDSDKLRLDIGQALSFQDISPITIKTTPVGVLLSDIEAQQYKERSENIANKALIMSYDEYTIEYTNNELLSLIDPTKGYKDKAISDLINKLSYNIEREPQNAVFIFQDNRVVEFTPAKDGVSVLKESLLIQILDSLAELENTQTEEISINIPVTTAKPEITTDSVNNLGIVERIGKGTSNFRGSIPSRVHNIKLASQNFNGILVRPGQTFSFNDSLGDVSSLTGYKQAYVIRDGKTVLGDGGGVCQVSTTLFRAALDAGLNIVERRAHSYRVGYYEQDSPPGLDATVYAPTTDLKIKNDTPMHILIQTTFDINSSTLRFEIYGTSDGRKSSITKPVVTSVTPPPEDLYIDDPNLPTGTIQQIDYKAWGAKVNFTYKVEKEGETIFEKTFYSNYHPWQAKFLRGTGPVI